MIGLAVLSVLPYECSRRSERGDTRCMSHLPLFCGERGAEGVEEWGRSIQECQLTTELRASVCAHGVFKAATQQGAFKAATQHESILRMKSHFICRDHNQYEELGCWMQQDAFAVFHRASCSATELPLIICSVWNHLTISFSLSLTLSGYHDSGPVVMEGARWESRHLLQEVYDNESNLYSEPEKNCTEPGKSSWEM